MLTTTSSGPEIVQMKRNVKVIDIDEAEMEGRMQAELGKLLFLLFKL